MGFFEFEGKTPSVASSCYVDNTAVIIGDVEIGENCFIGPGVKTTNVKYPNPKKKADEYEKTVIGKGVMVGAGSTILCGITIGDRAYIGAGSVVTKNVRPGGRVKGNPAK